MMRFAKNVYTADETLKNFGIDPEYRTAFKEHAQLMAKVGIVTLVLYISHVTLYYHIFESFHDAFIFILVIEYPMFANPSSLINFFICIR